MKETRKKRFSHYISRLIAALIVIAFLYLVKSVPEHFRPLKPHRIMAAISLGGLILIAWIMGDVFERISLPRITGYMVTGLVMGPYILGLIPLEAVRTLKFIDNVALALIALHAGNEVRLTLLKRRLTSILSITFFILLFSLTGVFTFIYVGGGHILPFLEGAPRRTILVVALLFGLIEVAKSPVTTIAILDETRARGRLAETTLGVVVLKDVLLIILFGIVMAVGARLAYPDEAHKSMVGQTLWHLFGSLGIGTAVGLVVRLLLRLIRENIYLLVIALALGLTILSKVLHVEVLLVSMTAGFIIVNFTRQQERFLEGIRSASPLIYLVFFPVASASLNITLVRETWFIAVIIIMIRKVMVFTGIYIGSRLVEDFPAMRRWGWMGFINQSGVTLALALVIGREFPEFGGHFTAIALSMIVLTDFYGPALFKYALHRAGETG